MLKTSILFYLIFFGAAWAAPIQESECTAIDIREINPQISANKELKKHFETPRNQDTISWCYAFTSADLISVELGIPISGIHMSALYNNYVINHPPSKAIQERIRKENPNNFQFAHIYELGWPNIAIDEAVKNGWVCSEKGLPFDKKYTNQIHELVLAMEKLKAKALKNKMSEKDICKKITNVISPFKLMDDQINKVAQSLVQDDLNKTFRLFAENACTEQVQKIPRMTMKTLFKKNGEDQFFKEINDNLLEGKIQTINYQMENFMITEGLHSSIILGRRWNKGKCEYNIRNSWGKSCASYKRGIDCNRSQGTFWVGDEELLKASTSIDYISNS